MTGKAETTLALGSKPVRRRNHEVDGIRGWASLSVLFGHVFLGVLGTAIPALRNHLTDLLFNGQFAVLVFFVLSGDALATGCMISRATMDRVIVKRYFRLSIPIFLSCALVYLLMVAHLDFHGPVVAMVKREDWLGGFLHFNPSIIGLFKFAFYKVYAEQLPDKAYNPILWTMGMELIGSLLVFAFCQVQTKIRHPLWVLATLSLWLLFCRSYYGLFFIGVGFAHLRKHGYFERIEKNLWGRFLAPLGFLLLAPCVVWIPFHLAFSAAFVFCVYSSPMLRRFFSNGISKFLGRISFSVYLIHFPVIISLDCWLISWTSVPFQLTRDQWWILAASVSVVVSLGLGTLFTLVEEWCLGWLDKGVRWIMSETGKIPSTAKTSD